MKKVVVPCIFALLFIGTGALAQMQEIKLLPGDAQPSLGFGISVTMDSVRAVIGATYDNVQGAHSGSAYVFKKDGDEWKEEQKLIPGDGEMGAQFGFAVAVNGQDILIGEPEDSEKGLDAGAVYHYSYNTVTNQWVQKEKIMPADAYRGDMFGTSICISGDNAIIGASGVDGNTGNDGAAYIYQKSDGSWIEVQKLVPQGIIGEAYFGSAVSLDGKFAIVGSYSDDELGKGAGAAYIFEKQDGTWVQKTKLSGNDTDNGDLFGLSVSISGEYAAVSGINVFNTCGVVYVFKYNIGNDSWEQISRLTDNSLTYHAMHGFSVCLDDNYLLAGVRSDNTFNGNSGSMYLYRRSGTDWHLAEKIYASNSVHTAQLGYSVFLYKDQLIGGAPHYYDEPDKASGAAFVYSGFYNPVSSEPSPSNESVLFQNYPNPVNSSTTISYFIASPGHTKLIIRNALGQQVWVLTDEFQSPGEYDISVDVKDFSEGLYFYQLLLDKNVIETKKMFVIR